MGYAFICDVCGAPVEPKTGGGFRFFNQEEKTERYDLCEDCKNVLQRAFEGLVVLRGGKNASN